MKYCTFCLLILSTQTYALSPDQVGSEGFNTITENTLPWSESVRFARDPGQNSNLIFSDQKMIEALADPESDYVFGMGSKEFITEAVNVSGNMTMAAAKTDPRNVNYIEKSLVTSLESLGSETPGNMAQLDQMQLGDSTQRFIEGQSIEPNIGTLQSVDNEQAFQSTYDNIMLGRAEEALYEGDRLDATSHFDSKSSEFKGSTDKQALASDYQKDGIMRSKQTAETFRDFFSYKSDVTSQNLSLMPTVPSLLSNCKSNTKANEDQLGAYNVSISDSERSFYEISPPSYDNIDFCESYIQMEQGALLQNLPVHDKLAAINDDSLQMAAGLDDLANKLDQKDLSAAQLAQILESNSAWNQLKERQSAWSECQKKDCLALLEAKVTKVINYEGADSELSEERKNLRKALANTIANKKLDPSISGSSSSRDFKNINMNSLNLQKQSNSGLSGALGGAAGAAGSLKHLKAHGASGDDSSVAALNGQSPSQGGTYYKQGQNRYGNTPFQRTESGVLVGPSGKPVMGHANPAHMDIFQIISSRYQKKFFKE